VIHHGDCLEVLRTLPDNSVDAVVTDPPYGLSFMGKRWDYDVPSVEVWAECLRVLKPGGHLLAFAGTRTQHRMAVRIEDAGFEIRDMIAWVYGSGFPKSLDVSKAIDKAEGHWRGRAGEIASENGAMSGGNYARTPKGDPITNSAKQWQGWGTALKPALEPITVARKPLIGTVAENVLTHGTGALNVDGCRVACDWQAERGDAWLRSGKQVTQDSWQGPNTKQAGSTCADRVSPQGRWPANLIHDGSDEVVGLFPGNRPSRGGAHFHSDGFAPAEVTNREIGYGDSGSAARFFYCAKASKADRDDGCDGLEERDVNRYGEQGQGPLPQQTPRVTQRNRNHHPTVKPTDLMRYLCRLVTPPNGTVLDPFTGSGSTGKAAKLEGFSFIGIEREAEYVAIAQARINSAKPHQPDLFS
jgi:site-specific DNA-methyltransferase (adenine-specific)